MQRAEPMFSIEEDSESRHCIVLTLPDAPRVVVTGGHGEPRPAGSEREPTQLGLFLDRNPPSAH
jgi:hypothetical protein